IQKITQTKEINFCDFFMIVLRTNFMCIHLEELLVYVNNTLKFAT
ncbi:uncharacterized protein METZ01_LOCUS451744, partial [marine metagenome]